MLTPKAIIDRFQLEPLDQEGGFFRQVWRSEQRIGNSVLGPSYPANGDHPLGTLIYFLLTAKSFSAMHRLPTPEHWFYHLGDPLDMLLLLPGGGSKLIRLGPDLLADEQPQVTTPAHSWQGSTLATLNRGFGYCFCSCAMTPGFEWSDFELGDAESLILAYPEQAGAIRARTRTSPVKGSL